MHQTISMAIDAPGKLSIQEVQPRVLLTNIALIMFMAGIAGVLLVSGNMAELAIFPGLVSMGNWKLMAVQLRWNPVQRFMAIFTLQSKETCMYFRFWMAIFTFVGCPLVYLVHMAGLAFDHTVAAFQGEEFLVNKIPHPINTIMALKTFATQFSLVLGYEDLVSGDMTIDTGFH
jgi:hypothetical protein